MPDTLSLFTRVRNSSDASKFYGFLGPHGTTLAAAGTYDFPGDLVQSLANKPLQFAALQAALNVDHTLEIVRQPAAILLDTATGATKQIALTNGSVVLADPNWGSFDHVLTGAFGAISTPQVAAVSSASLVFDTAVTGFGLTKITLKRSGGANLLVSAPTTSDNITWAIPSLSGLTDAAGTYVLEVPATSTVVDAFDNPILTPITRTWVRSLTGAFGAISSPQGAAVASTTLVFNSAVTGFGLSKITLTLDGGPNLLVTAPTTSDNITWTIPSLTGLTNTAGVYLLTVAADPAILSNGIALTTPITRTWTRS